MFTQNKHLGERGFGLSLQAGKETQRQSARTRYEPVVKRDTGIVTGFNGTVFPIYEAIVTTAITSATGSAWGKGQVQLYYFDPTQPNFPVADDNGDDGAGNSNVLCWFLNAGTIGVGKHCYVVRAAGGWRVMVWDC